jgi:protein gp37
MNRTKIEWTDGGSTWNPIRARCRETGRVGWFCEHATPGCAHCYSETMNRRLGTGIDFKAQNRDKVEIFLDEKILTEPLRWRAPKKIFLCSMTDAFADFVKTEWLAEIFGVAAVAARPFHGPGDGKTKCGTWTGSDGKERPLFYPNMRHGPHTIIVLTKRADRMRALLSTGDFRLLVSRAAYRHAHNRVTAGGLADAIEGGSMWPLPNVWAGVSVEDQPRWDERWPALAATPAAVRWISYEPALGPVVFDAMPGNALDWLGRLSWVVVGGESGPGARPFRIEWARSIIAECKWAGIPVFLKQLGAVPIIDDRPPFNGGFPDGTHFGNRTGIRELNGLQALLRDRKGGDPAEWVPDLRVRQYPGQPRA